MLFRINWKNFTLRKGNAEPGRKTCHWNKKRCARTLTIFIATLWLWKKKIPTLNIFFYCSFLPTWILLHNIIHRTLRPSMLTAFYNDCVQEVNIWHLINNSVTDFYVTTGRDRKLFYAKPNIVTSHQIFYIVYHITCILCNFSSYKCVKIRSL